jgi:uncharacterized protein (TIGR03086 family)
MTGSTEAITALERAYDDLARVVAGLDGPDLERATDCGGWDVRALLDHTLGTAVMFTLVNAGLAAGEDAGDVVADDPAGALARTSVDNLASWRRDGAQDGERTYPWGTYPAGVALRINVSEIAIHSWDLARATGQEARLDAGVAQIVYDLYRQIPMDGLRAKGVFGAEIAARGSATVQERLLGLLGRKP